MKQRPSKTDRQSLCDPETNKYALTLKLVRGDATVCPPTKVAYRVCRRRQERAAGEKGSKKGMGRKQKQQQQQHTEATTPSGSVHLGDGIHRYSGFGDKGDDGPFLAMMCSSIH